MCEAPSEPRQNLYLDRVVDWQPEPCGEARSDATDPGLIDAEGMPLRNDRAFGPPHGTGCGHSGADLLVLGVGGSATFAFAPGRYIYDGPGPDFITFEGRFAWSCQCDQMVNELAHVLVSEDGSHFYYNAAERYDGNPTPGQDHTGYVHDHVGGLHGKSPTWGNPDHPVQAQTVVDGAWVDLPGVWVCPDIDPADPHLGGDRFDLSTFRSVTDDAPWPPTGRMRYVRIVDDPGILDGQDYAVAWATGAHVQAALGIHVASE